MANKTLVSFASKGRENYPKAQLRMIRSAVLSGWGVQPDETFLIRSLDGDCDEYQGVKIRLGSYPLTSTNNHAEIPYGFKPDIILEAVNEGAQLVIWNDSTICMKLYPNNTIKHAKTFGVAAFENLGHPLWSWISDHALAQQQLTEVQLKHIKQIMACCICFDFEHPVGKLIFDQWYAASRDGVSFQNYGSSRADFKAHRHDQAVLSCLLFKYGIPLLPYGDLVYQPHDSTGEFGYQFEWVNKAVDAPL